MDSGEDAEVYDQMHPYPLPLPSMHHIHHNGSAGGATPPSVPPVCVGVPSAGPSPQTVGTSPVGAVISSPSSITPAAAGAAAAAARQSRKLSNGRPSRHKLHETKL